MSEPVHGISSLHRTPAGLSRETWTFDVDVGSPDDRRIEAMVLRRDPERGLGLLDTDRHQELALLRALEGSTVPTPEVLHADLGGEHLARPSLVLKRSPGICDYLVLNGERPLAERLDLAEQFCRLLAEVHRLDWEDLGVGALLPDPGPDAAESALDEWSGTLRARVPSAHPELTLIERWLRWRMPTSRRTVLVHGDFKPGNTLLVESEISVLLDWETAHLGDPLEDLGWVTQPLRRREHLIEGHWDQSLLIDRYRAETGFSVDPEALAWWQAFASYKTAVIQLCGLGEYVTGVGNRLFREPAECIRLLLDCIGSDDVRVAGLGNRERSLRLG